MAMYVKIYEKISSGGLEVSPSIGKLIIDGYQQPLLLTDRNQAGAQLDY